MTNGRLPAQPRLFAHFVYVKENINHRVEREIILRRRRRVRGHAESDETGLPSQGRFPRLGEVVGRDGGEVTHLVHFGLVDDRADGHEEVCPVDGGLLAGVAGDFMFRCCCQSDCVRGGGAADAVVEEVRHLGRGHKALLQDWESFNN